MVHCYLWVRVSSEGQVHWGLFDHCNDFILIHLASWKSFGWIITQWAWMARSLESWKRWTISIWVLSVKAWQPTDCILISALPILFKNSWTSHWNGSLLGSTFELHWWYHLISLRVRVPGHYFFCLSLFFSHPLSLSSLSCSMLWMGHHCVMCNIWKILYYKLQLCEAD